jgi:hypothetical protein
MCQLCHVRMCPCLTIAALQLHPQPPLPSPITFFNCHRCVNPRCAFGAAAVGCVCVRMPCCLSLRMSVRTFPALFRMVPVTCFFASTDAQSVRGRCVCAYGRMLLLPPEATKLRAQRLRRACGR